MKLYKLKRGENVEDRTGKKWSREETILAFELYCRTPFAKITKTNKEIINLAKLLGRTPSSVGLKMANLAHYDPELQERKVSGMSHTSKLDRIIYDEYSNNIEELSFTAQSILADMQHTSVDTLLSELQLYDIPTGVDKDYQAKIRIGQYFFRMSVLMSYGNACCVTGISNKELLVASHIKPWRVSDEKTERTNPSNGLCLNAMHDKAFDRGLITIDKNFHIINSRYLEEAVMDENTRQWFDYYNGKEIVLPDKFLPGKEFIEYHNDVIFQGA